MKLGRSQAAKSKPVALPERSQSVTLMPAGGKPLPARVLERGPDMLLVAIMVPTEPLTYRQLDGLVLEFVAPRGRVRLTGTVSIEDPAEPDVVRIDGPRSIEVLQEREYVRIKSARPALVYGGPDKIPVRELHRRSERRWLPARRLDSLKIGDEVQFQLTLTPGVLPIGGTGKVVRVDGQGRRAVEFESISELDRRRLIRFIFECQRAERQRGLEPEGRYGD